MASKIFCDIKLDKESVVFFVLPALFLLEVREISYILRFLLMPKSNLLEWIFSQDVFLCIQYVKGYNPLN